MGKKDLEYKRKMFLRGSVGALGERSKGIKKYRLVVIK